MFLDRSQGDKQDAASTADDPTVPAAITDTGCERELNEDRYAVIESPSGLTWLVCDGMGGVSGGELAAQLAIDAIRRHLENRPARSPEVALRTALLEANRMIILRRQNPAFSQMGTTAVGVIFSGAEVVIGHAGDSRAYLVREGSIQQLTVDHTFVQHLVDKGQIQPVEALNHPQAHILTRCLGSEPALEIDLLKFWLGNAPADEHGDSLLLCTDGLYSLVSEEEVAQLVATLPPQQVCVRLVELAKERGGFDNITIAVIPLGGRLQKEPPSGYKPARREAAQAKKKNATPSFLRTFSFVLILTVLSVLLTVSLVAKLVSE